MSQCVMMNCYSCVQSKGFSNKLEKLSDRNIRDLGEDLELTGCGDDR